jgi:hypothetical protein
MASPRFWSSHQLITYSWYIDLVFAISHAKRVAIMHNGGRLDWLYAYNSISWWPIGSRRAAKRGRSPQPMIFISNIRTFRCHPTSCCYFFRSCRRWRIFGICFWSCWKRIRAWVVGQCSCGVVLSDARNSNTVKSIVVFFNDYPNNHHTIQFKYTLFSTAVWDL